MFDLVSGVIDRPFRDTHTAAAAASLATHLLALGGVAWMVLSSLTQTVPEVPQMMAFVAEAPPLPPPPPPPPAAKAPKATSPSTPAPKPGAAFAAPAVIPDGIQPELGLDLGGEGGVVGGVEGGIPGGVLGGLLGGTVVELPPPPPPPAKPVRIGGNITAPNLVHRVEPVYPGVAVSAKVSGTVILESTVDEAGMVTDVRVLRSIQLLDQAAIKAVKQWRYEPLVLNGIRAPFILVVTLTFSFR
jgi:protein TonB